MLVASPARQKSFKKQTKSLQCGSRSSVARTAMSICSNVRVRNLTYGTHDPRSCSSHRCSSRRHGLAAWYARLREIYAKAVEIYSLRDCSVPYALRHSVEYQAARGCACSWSRRASSFYSSPRTCFWFCLPRADIGVAFCAGFALAFTMILSDSFNHIGGPYLSATQSCKRTGMKGVYTRWFLVGLFASDANSPR
jgi:hypothetical protein